MPNADELLIELANEAADEAREKYLRGYRFMAPRAESPIEQTMLAALMRVMDANEDLVNGVHWCCGPYVYGEERQPFDAVFAYSQAIVLKYRVDFLFDICDAGARHCLVVECDGHDYHERTKEQAARDRSRDRRMIAAGINVMRFTGSEIWADPRKCADEVWRMIERIWLGPFADTAT